MEENFSVFEKILLDVALLGYVFERMPKKSHLRLIETIADLRYKSRLAVYKRLGLFFEESKYLAEVELMVPDHRFPTSGKKFFMSCSVFLHHDLMPCVVHFLFENGMFLRHKEVDDNAVHFLCREWNSKHKFNLTKKLLRFFSELVRPEDFAEIQNQHAVGYLDRMYPKIVDSIMTNGHDKPNNTFMNPKNTKFFEERMNSVMFFFVGQVPWRKRMIQCANPCLLPCLRIMKKARVIKLNAQEFEAILSRKEYREQMYRWTNRQWICVLNVILTMEDAELFGMFVLTRNRMEDLRKPPAFGATSAVSLENNNGWLEQSMDLTKYSLGPHFDPLPKSTFSRLAEVKSGHFLDFVTETSIKPSTMLKLVQKYGFSEESFRTLTADKKKSVFSYWAMMYLMSVHNLNPTIVQSPIFTNTFIFIALHQEDKTRYSGMYKKNVIVSYLRMIPDKHVMARIMLCIHVIDRMFFKQTGVVDSTRVFLEKVDPIWLWDCYDVVMNFLKDHWKSVSHAHPVRTFRQSVCMDYNFFKPHIFDPSSPVMIKNDDYSGFPFMERIPVKKSYSLKTIDECYFQMEFSKYNTMNVFQYDVHRDFLTSAKIKPRNLKMLGAGCFPVSKNPQDIHFRNLVGRRRTFQKTISPDAKDSSTDDHDDIVFYYECFFFTKEFIPWRLFDGREFLPPTYSSFRQSCYSVNDRDFSDLKIVCCC